MTSQVPAQRVRSAADGDAPRRPKIVVIGGGTGTFTVLSGLKRYPVDLTAVVAMSDDGSSTGRLRDEYGVLPPGDLRQCLVALSEADGYMRELFNFRFDRGDLKGHSFGNILISTLEQITGSIDQALVHAADILKIRGAVVPVTLDNVRLVTELVNGKRLEGEHELDDYQLISKFGIKRMTLTPTARANKRALAAIKEADLVIIGPGSLYTSLVPNLLVRGIPRALAKTSAHIVFICNLMNKHGQTDDFTLPDYVRTLEAVAGFRIFDTMLYNTKRPPARLLKKYMDEGEPIARGLHSALAGRAVVGRDLLADAITPRKAGDRVVRTLIRHDPDKLAKAIMELI